MEEIVNDITDENNEKNHEEKEAECLDDTSPDKMEEGVSELKNDKSEKMMRRKRQNS